MVANNLKISDENILGKMIKGPLELKNLINGCYKVSLINEELTIQIGKTQLKLKEKVTSKVCQNRTVTYILGGNKKLTFLV